MELTRPFAENGDRQDFPVDTQGDGTMSLQQGFGTFYGLPPEEGGLFIQRPQFNQLMYLVSKGVIDNKTSIADALEQIQSLESEYGSLVTNSPKLLTENLTWTIGSGQETATHFNTLEKAISEALKYTKQNNLTITLQLTEDLTLTQGLNFNFCDCRNIIIDGQNYEIQMNMSSTNNVMISAFFSTFLPRFSNITFKNTGSNDNGICFNILHNSNLTLGGTKYEIDNFNIGINLEASSSASISSGSGKIKNCKYGARSLSLSRLDMRQMTLENNENAIFLVESGFVDCYSTFFQLNTYDCNISFNTLTPQGICFKQ